MVVSLISLLLLYLFTSNSLSVCCPPFLFLNVLTFFLSIISISVLLFFYNTFPSCTLLIPSLILYLFSLSVSRSLSLCLSLCLCMTVCFSLSYSLPPLLSLSLSPPLAIFVSSSLPSIPTNISFA